MSKNGFPSVAARLQTHSEMHAVTGTVAAPMLQRLQSLFAQVPHHGWPSYVLGSGPVDRGFDFSCFVWEHFLLILDSCRLIVTTGSETRAGWSGAGMDWTVEEENIRIMQTLPASSVRRFRKLDMLPPVRIIPQIMSQASRSREPHESLNTSPTSL